MFSELSNDQIMQMVEAIKGFSKKERKIIAGEGYLYSKLSKGSIPLSKYFDEIQELDSAFNNNSRQITFDELDIKVQNNEESEVTAKHEKAHAAVLSKYRIAYILYWNGHPNVQDSNFKTIAINNKWTTEKVKKILMEFFEAPALEGSDNAVTHFACDFFFYDCLSQGNHINPCDIA